MRLVPLLVVVSFVTLSFPAAADDHGDGKPAVLITGASSGIGRNMAETLARNGFFVYAGARKQEDLDALNAIENVEAVRLDVTSQADISAAVAQVREGGRGLYGLINNAGIFIGGPLIEVDIDEFNWLMDVNVYGVYRVTQAFAPMIIESKGRIMTTGSIAGILSGQFMGQYSMSKHAIEAFTDSLAAEMQKFGVGVSVIEPGNYDSNIAHTAFARFAEKAYLAETSYYKEEMTAFLAGDGDRGHHKDPDEVSAAALHALTAERPHRRYMVVPQESEADLTIDQVLRELIELNEYQAYSFSREELIEKLDAALAARQE